MHKKTNEEEAPFYTHREYYLRDASSSPFVRMVNGKEQRYIPSPELSNMEARDGKPYEYPPSTVIVQVPKGDGTVGYRRVDKTEEFLKTGKVQ